MSVKVIPIRPARQPAVAPAAENGPPRLDGDPGRVQPLLRELQRAVDRELGERVPAAAWLRELRLDDDECVVALAPGLRQQGQHVAEAAFATLRRLLSDTDIYVGAAA
ncbi:MAG: hypothetical protein KIT17_16970 [Rubrivivax sp.]|nr:hypothetical protein [Rubrivivax sp.]